MFLCVKNIIIFMFLSFNLNRQLLYVYKVLLKLKVIKEKNL